MKTTTVKSKWCKAIRNIFCDYDMLELYETKAECDLNCKREKMLGKYYEEWKLSVESKPKLRTYKKIKCNFGTEEYVKINLTRPQRSIVAQIRLGILPLYIETGRYTGVKVENRICSLCNQNKVENELHFLMSCTYYKNERSLLSSET